MSKTTTTPIPMTDDKSRTVTPPTFIPSAGKRPHDVLELLEEALLGIDHLQHVNTSDSRELATSRIDLEKVIAYFKIYIVK